jgi:peptidoglycan hydrolase-like protein with peptidoglycan-binding domain
MAELSQRPSRRRVARRTGPVAAGLAILLVAGGTGWRLTRRPAGHAVAGPGVPTATATVVRTDLKTSTQVSGVLGHAGSYQVIGQGRGGTVTALPAPGQVITRGQAVYEVDGQPVRLFYGPRPSWRPLAVGVTAGPDVRELEENLVALGYAGPAGLTPDDRYTAATDAAVRRWQRATGQPVTGQLDVGAVTYEPGPIRVGAVAAHLGAPAGSGEPVLTATSTTVVVSVPVPTAQSYLVHVGDAVTVTLPAGETTAGRVESVSTVATGPDASSGLSSGPSSGSPQRQDGPVQATVPVIVSLTSPSGTPDAVANLDQAPVTVNVTNQSATGVLAVPITALVALAGGGYGVYVRSGGARRLVAVTPGLFADTLVEIRGSASQGDALHEGDTVEVPVG